VDGILAIDELDRKILRLLSQNPEISQSEISESLRISQPAVNMRIHKLQEKGVLARLVGVNVKKAELFLAKIDVSTNNTEPLLNFVNNCPLYFNSFLTSGRYNLMIFLIGENVRSLMSCVDTHLRQNALIKDYITDMEFSIIVTPVQDFVVPIKPVLDKKKTAPCGTDCSSCSLHGDRCLGCPATIHYKGALL